MAFLTKEEINTVMYGYQVEQITEGDDTIIDSALAIAIEEVRGYLTFNDKKEWNDGRPIYDVEAIFNATGVDRNPLILQYVKVCAKWHIVLLCNADIIYETAKEAYDRVTKMLEKIQAGEINISALPKMDPEDESLSTREPFTVISRTKFNHE